MKRLVEMLENVRREMLHNADQKRIELNNATLELNDIMARSNQLIEHGCMDNEKMEYMAKLLHDATERKRLAECAVHDFISSAEYYQARVLELGGIGKREAARKTFNSLLDWCDYEEQRGMTMQKAARTAAECRHPENRRRKRIFTSATVRELYALPESRWFPGEIGIISLSRMPVAVVTSALRGFRRFTIADDDLENIAAGEWYEERRLSDDKF